MIKRRENAFGVRAHPESDKVYYGKVFQVLRKVAV